MLHPIHLCTMKLLLIRARFSWYPTNEFSTVRNTKCWALGRSVDADFKNRYILTLITFLYYSGGMDVPLG